MCCIVPYVGLDGDGWMLLVIVEIVSVVEIVCYSVQLLVGLNNGDQHFYTSLLALYYNSLYFYV